MTLYAANLKKLYFSSERQEERSSIRHRLHRLIHGLSYDNWSEDSIGNLFQETEGWVDREDKIFLARLYLKKASSPHKKAALYRAIILSLFDNGQYTEMMDYIKSYINILPAQQRLDALMWALRLTMATGNPEWAWRLTQWALPRFSEQVAFLDQAIVVARQTGRKSMLVRLMKKRLSIQPNHDQAWALFRLLVASGDVREATRYIKMLDETKLRPRQQRLIAQVYEWQGRPKDALSWWLQYARHVKNRAVEEKLWRLAIGMRRLDLAQRILEQAATARALTFPETKELVSIYLAKGLMGKAKRLLERQVEKLDYGKEITTLLYQFYLDSHDYASAASLLRKGIEAGKLSVEKWVDYARLLWALRRSSQAYDALKEHESTLVGHKRYWEMRLSLAIYENDFVDASRSYRMLRNRFKDWRGNAFLLNDIANGLILGGRKRLAAHFLYEFGDVEKKLYAVRIVLELGDVDQASTWLSQIEYPKSPKSQSVYWALQARLFELKGELKLAWEGWGRALLSEPNNVDIQKAFIWSLIAHAKELKSESAFLKGYLDALQARMPASQDNDWTAILAYGYMSIGEYARALYWFKQGLPFHQENPDWLLGMAEAFKLSGLPVYADRLKQYVWRTLLTRYIAEGLQVEDQRQLLALTHQFLGAPVAWSLLKEVGRHFSERLRVEVLMEWALAQSDVLSAQYYYGQARRLGIKLPGWQQLGYGLMMSDEAILHHVLTHYQYLPQADRVVALNRLGMSGKAVSEGLAALEWASGDTVVAQVRRAVVSVRSALENGLLVGVKATTRDILDIGLFEAKIGRIAGGKRAWGVDLKRYVLHSTQILPVYQKDQADARLMWQTGGSRYLGRLTVSLQDRAFRQVAGMDIDWKYQYGQRLRYGVRLYQATRPEVSGTLWGWGLQEGGETQIEYIAERNVYMNMAAGWRRFASLWGERVGEGPYAQATLTYQLWDGDPVWRVGGTLEWFSATVSKPSRIPRLLALFAVTPPVETILPSEYGRVGLTTQWQHGEVHRISHASPSPRWSVEMSLGYQWVRNVFDYGVYAGLGWRVMSDDELGISIRWGTDGLSTTQPYWESRLTYSVFWGR